MTNKKRELTTQRLREVVDYNPVTGVFIWKSILKRSRRKVGEVAGYVGKDSIYISIDGVTYRAHHLAWLYVHGVLPEKNLDHKNVNFTDNSIANLRPCNQSQNLANTRIRKNSISGFKGVSWIPEKKKWRANVMFNGKNRFLGYFDNAEKAAEAYRIGAAKYFGEFARCA